MRTFSRIFASLLLAIAAAASASAAAAGDTPRVTRSTIATVEKDLDNRFTRLWNDNQFAVLGPSRGVYLEGYGAVFTTEVNLVQAPVMGIVPIPVTKEGIAEHKKLKRQRIPALKRALQQALADTAASKEMAAVPAEEQIVLVVFLSHYPWEDLEGLPAQIMMQASKKKLLDARGGAGGALEAAIQSAQF